MPTLHAERISELLQPFVHGSLRVTETAAGQLSTYLDLLVRWNARVSLTSIRSPEEIVLRHFGESVFTAAALRDRVHTGTELLDFGSGAGFPGLPIQIMIPEIRVTVAESQARKAAFLQEAVRTLGLGAEVWSRRVEEMPADRRFDLVTMRAVDRMGKMQELAGERVRPGGWLARLVGGSREELDGELWAIPGSERRWLAICSVPRGTQPSDRV